MQFACLSSEARDAHDYTSFEQEEAQIQAVFKEAIRLKRRVKEMVCERNELTRTQDLLHEQLAVKDEKMRKVMNKRDKELAAVRDEHEKELVIERHKLDAAQEELRRHSPVIVSMKAQLLALEEELRARHVGFIKQEQELREYLRPQLETVQNELRSERLNHLEEANKGRGMTNEQNKKLIRELMKATMKVNELTTELEVTRNDLKRLIQCRSDLNTTVQAVLQENRSLKRNLEAQKQQLILENEQSKKGGIVDSHQVQQEQSLPSDANPLAAPISRGPSSIGKMSRVSNTTAVGAHVHPLPMMSKIDGLQAQRKLRTSSGPGGRPSVSSNTGGTSTSIKIPHAPTGNIASSTPSIKTSDSIANCAGFGSEEETSNNTGRTMVETTTVLLQQHFEKIKPKRKENFDSVVVAALPTLS